MADIVLRVRLTGGGQIDVVYHASDADSTDDVIEHIIATLRRIPVFFAHGTAIDSSRCTAAVLPASR